MSLFLQIQFDTRNNLAAFIAFLVAAHSPSSLATAALLLKEEFIVVGEPDESYLIELVPVSESGEPPEMPKKAGVSYGATDEFGRRAQIDPVTVWDFYATVLHILGFDHEKLNYYHNGFDRRLTNVHGSVIRDRLA